MAGPIAQIVGLLMLFLSSKSSIAFSVQKQTPHAFGTTTALSAQQLSDSVNVIERRRLLSGGVAAVVAIAAGTAEFGINSRDDVTDGGRDDTTITTASKSLYSITEAVETIAQACDRRFWNAVVASDYKFLYRGIQPQGTDETAIIIQNESYDLLLPETYGSHDAVRFFSMLDTEMANSPVKPSNGHLATASAKDAAQWGTAASIWPLGNAHFAWFENGGLFYPRPESVTLKPPFTNLIVDGRNCGRDGLEDVLRSDNCEVLFCADSFLAVPAKYDRQLRQSLKTSFILPGE